MPAFSGDLLSQMLALDLLKNIRVSVAHSFKSMLSDPELTLAAVVCVPSFSAVIVKAQADFKGNVKIKSHFQ